MSRIVATIEFRRYV